MSPLETTLTIAIAIVLVAMAAYFAWHQRATLRNVHYDLKLSAEHRRYLLRQVGRRIFGSLLLLLLAGLLVGSLFLDYEAMQVGGENEPIPESAKQSLRLISFYWMTTLLVLMVIVSVAVIDLWATARFGFQQQKQLMLDHQVALETELARLKHERRE